MCLWLPECLGLISRSLEPKSYVLSRSSAPTMWVPKAYIVQAFSQIVVTREAAEDDSLWLSATLLW